MRRIRSTCCVPECPSNQEWRCADSRVPRRNIVPTELRTEGTSLATPAVNPWLIAVTVTLATFMELLDTSIANVSLPYIGGGLGRSYDEVTWILTTYLVANAVILPMSAWF